MDLKKKSYVINYTSQSVIAMWSKEKENGGKVPVD